MDSFNEKQSVLSHAERQIAFQVWLVDGRDQHQKTAMLPCICLLIIFQCCQQWLVKVDLEGMVGIYLRRYLKIFWWNMKKI